jgi:cell division septal protein FtsQ
MSEPEAPLLRGTRALAKGAPRPRRSLPAAPRLEMPVLPGEDAPFLRPKQRTRVRRARRSGLLQAALGVQVLAAVLLVSAALWAGWRQVLRSERLKVRTVEVHGNRFLSEGEVRELLGPADGANILTLDIDDLKRRLRASPWLEDASVRRTLPDTLRVEVREREPLALAEVGRLYLMDAGGDLIDLYAARTSGFDLPIVRGLAGLDDQQRRDRAARVAGLLLELGELQAEVSEVAVEASGDLRVVLRRGGEVLRLGEPPYKAGVRSFLGMRRELVERCPRAEYFDLRFRGRIFAKEPVEPKAPVEAAPPEGDASQPRGETAAAAPAGHTTPEAPRQESTSVGSRGPGGGSPPLGSGAGFTPAPRKTA